MKNIQVKTTDDMFTVKSTQNIKWYGYPFYFLMLYLYSYLTNYFTGCSLYVTPISWFFDMIIFYAWHVQAHHRIKWIPFNEFTHNMHNLHHQHYFPAKYFYGTNKAHDWINKCNDEWFLIKHALPLGELKPFESLKNESLGIIMTIFVIGIKYYLIKLPINVIIFTVIQGLLIDFIGNYLHLSFHIQNHWLNKFETYKELKYLHWIHHKGDTKRNYAIFFFGLDKIFNTYVRSYDKK
jgi:hypothetical protein